MAALIGLEVAPRFLVLLVFISVFVFWMVWWARGFVFLGAGFVSAAHPVLPFLSLFFDGGGGFLGLGARLSPWRTALTMFVMLAVMFLWAWWFFWAFVFLLFPFWFIPGLATNSIFLCFLFMKKSLICLEGKLMNPHQGNTSLPFLPATPLSPSQAL